MTAVYGIYVIQLGYECWLAELTDALAAELEAIGLHRSLDVQVSETPPHPDVPAVALYMGDEEAAADPLVIQRVERALDDGTLVIPVVADLARFASSVPERLLAINGFAYQGAGAASALARLVLEELGIEDRQRRVFISHKREDGLHAAEQLHDRLTHQRFLPFIDRFAIPHGRRAQDAIADALEDHAFMLLLETPKAHLSEWVYDEVEYALSHQMGIAILTWPGDPRPVPASNRLPRTKLADTDLRDDGHGFQVLTDEALERVVAEVEAAHAHGIVRRRRNLAQSVEDAAVAAGASCTPQRSWRLLVQHAGTRTLVGVTPRLPCASDLQYLDEARSLQDEECSVLLVHAARRLREPLREHLRWVAGDREMTLGPENAIGGQWR